MEPEPERTGAAWSIWDFPDHDGVPSVTDNCPDDFNPRAFNPDDPNNLERQPNCNWDSEVESGQWDFDVNEPGPTFPPGDACDPNPCGDTYVWPNATDTVLPGGVPGTKYLDRNIDVDGRVDWVTAKEPLTTGLRFCLCSAADRDDPAVRIACENDQGDNTGLCSLNDLAAYDNPPDEWWYRITVLHDQGGFDADIDYEDGVGDFEPSYEFWWQILDDAFDLGQPTPQFLDWEMRGVMWTHTLGEADGGPFDPGKRILTNHYLSRGFGQNVVAHAFSSSAAPFGPVLLPESLCDDCAVAFPRAWMMIPPCAGQQGCTVPEARHEKYSRDLTPLFTSGSLPGLGGVAGTWIAASEPDRAFTPTRPRYVAFATNGTTVNSLLSMTSTGLARSTPNNPTKRPSSRSEFGRVLSSNENRAWVIGGVNGSGALLQDLWSYDFTTQVWTQHALTSATKPARVLAAAYEPFERFLIVLDKYTQGGSTTIRLLRIDRNGPTATVLASWPRTKTNTTFALAALPSGEGYVVACTSTAATHALLRLDWTTSSIVLNEYQTGSGALTSAQVHAGVEGVSVMTPDAQGRPSPVGHRYIDLLVATGSTPALCF